MNLMPIAEFLEEEDFGKMGDSIFINMIPADAPRGILLRNDLSGTPIDYELPGYFKTNFQVIVRSENFVEGEERINAILAALTLRDRRLGNMHINYMRPRTEPVVFPLSVGNLLEFATYVDISFVKD